LGFDARIKVVPAMFDPAAQAAAQVGPPQASAASAKSRLKQVQ